MRARSDPTPLSIKIVAVALLLDAALRMFAVSQFAPLWRSPGVIFSAAIGVAALMYFALTLWRLSRWPILLHTALSLASATMGLLNHYRWKWGHPISSVLATIGMLVLFLVLTLPHWRKMNWALFGRPYRPTEDQVEVFA